MLKTAKISSTDALRLRVLGAKAKFKGSVTKYTILYEYEFGKQSEKQLQRIRAVWNLREVDEEITKNLEKIAKNL